MPEQIGLLSKKPSYIGDENKFASLGILQWRGDKFMVFINIEDGRVYIEEVFTAEAQGAFIAGFKQVEDDKIWAMLSYAANAYGLTSQKHIQDCIKELHPKATPATEAILKGINPETLDIKAKE